MTTNQDDDFEPHHTSSPTDQVLHELQLYGYRPFNDEPDPRPLPEANILAGSISDIFDALVVALADTRLEPDLEDLLWSTVNVFHRAIELIERELDDNELAQQRSQREQDGSEVKSVELERLTSGRPRRRWAQSFEPSNRPQSTSKRFPPASIRYFEPVTVPAAPKNVIFAMARAFLKMHRRRGATWFVDSKFCARRQRDFSLTRWPSARSLTNSPGSHRGSTNP